jgi:DinB superfamily
VSTENPYDKFLDGRELDAVLTETADKIAEYLEVIGPNQAKEPAPGKWSAAEIVCHLADCEMVFGFRLRQTLAEDEPTIEPFDQDKWAKTYKGVPASLALETFGALRKWNLRLIEITLPSAAANRKMTHPERGTMTFKTIVETMAGHDLNHLGQLKKLAGMPG